MTLMCTTSDRNTTLCASTQHLHSRLYITGPEAGQYSLNSIIEAEQHVEESYGTRLFSDSRLGITNNNGKCPAAKISVMTF